MASPSIVSATVNTGSYTVGSLTAVDVSLLGSSPEGNVIFACMVIVGVLVDPGIITAPVGQGWELIQQNLTGSGSTTRVAVFSKVSSGNEPGGYSFNWTNISSIGFWIMAEYAGCNPDDAIDGPGASQQNISGISSVAPSVNPATWNNYNTLVCVWAAELSTGNIMSMGAPSGMMLQAQSSSNLISFPALMLADLKLTSEAPTSTKTATAAFATPSLGISFLISQSIWAGQAPVGSSGGM